MAEIEPFRAIRPATDKVAHVASRSYEEYDKKELKAILEYNPYSFLHIINPGFKYHKNTSGNERFQLVRNRYLEFLEEETFIKDDEPCFYLYQINQGDFNSLGLFCATSIEDYRNNIIKKHEDTLKKRVVLFTDYLKTVGFNAEPVLLTYTDNSKIKNLIQEETNSEPEYDFASTDGCKHKLWKISNPKKIKEIQSEFKKLSSLYIADGHHRSASSNLLAEQHDTEDASAIKYFLSYLIPENEVRISGFNRMITDLNGLTKEAFLVRLDEFFRIEQKKFMAFRPKIRHQFTMYLDGDFYLLHLRKHVYQFSDALSHLDTHILYQTILNPILGINDLRNDKRISYSQGKASLLELKESVDHGPFAVGFSTAPIAIDEIKAVADANQVMPPKSTYIEPKLRSGLTIYEL